MTRRSSSSTEAHPWAPSSSASSATSRRLDEGTDGAPASTHLPSGRPGSLSAAEALAGHSSLEAPLLIHDRRAAEPRTLELLTGLRHGERDLEDEPRRSHRPLGRVR